MTREEELLEVAKSGGFLDLEEALPGKGVLGKLSAPGFHIDARDAQGNTALLLVARRGDNRMLKLLLERD